MSVLGDLHFACKKVVSVKEEVEISETHLLEQIFVGVEVAHADPCVKAEKESVAVNGLCHETEDNQTEPNGSAVISKQQYVCNLRPDDSTSSARKHDDIRPSLKNHTCSICKKSFRTSSRLAIHMNIHAGIRPYACTTCPRKYASRDGLREHILSHSSGFKCTLCEKSYTSRSGMNQHIEIHHGERNFQCEICSKPFASKYLLSRHHKTHEKKYECTLCSEKFTQVRKRLTHEKTHRYNHRNDNECENCKNYFKSEDQYRSHLKGNKCKDYVSENPLKCSKCENESFVSIEHLNQHNFVVHPPRRKNRTCSVCGKIYKCKYRLRLHMNVHTGNLPYACTICSKRYALPSSLRRHKLTHNFLSADEKIPRKFNCTLCEKSYCTKITLIGHMYFHRGERPFKCEICPKSFTNPGYLRSHVKTHSGERKYECTLCNKKSRDNTDRRKHEKTHTNSRMNYQCQKCKMYFRLEDQYRSHLNDNKCKGYASEKPFECSKCDQKFVSIESLDQHKVEIHLPPRKNQTSKKYHKCSHCAKAYTSSLRLERHKNVHTDNRPYACTICAKRFAWPSYLLNHMLTHRAEAKNLPSSNVH